MVWLSQLSTTKHDEIEDRVAQRSIKPTSSPASKKRICQLTFIRTAGTDVPVQEKITSSKSGTALLSCGR